MAASVPAPMARPRPAWASAAALTPLPAVASERPSPYGLSVIRSVLSNVPTEAPPSRGVSGCCGPIHVLGLGVHVVLYMRHGTGAPCREYASALDLATAACAVHPARCHHRSPAGLIRSLHRTAPVLLAAGLLPVPALLANDAPGAAWGLWGATTIAAALVYAVGDTLRDVPPRTWEAAQAGRRP